LRAAVRELHLARERPVLPDLESNEGLPKAFDYVAGK